MIPKIPPKLKELVLYRLDTTLPQDFKLVIGNKGAFSKKELREHIVKEDEIGHLYANMQLNFLKALANGEITEALEECQLS